MECTNPLRDWLANSPQFTCKVVHTQRAEQISQLPIFPRRDLEEEEIQQNQGPVPFHFLPCYQLQRNSIQLNKEIVSGCSLHQIYDIKNWKQPKFPLLEEQITQLCYSLPLENYKALRKNEAKLHYLSRLKGHVHMV